MVFHFSFFRLFMIVFLSLFTGSVAMLVRACLCAYTVLYVIFTFFPGQCGGYFKEKVYS